MNAKDDDLAELIGETHCLMRGQHDEGWDARAVGCTQYMHGDTPAEAMRAAVAFRDNKPTPRRRRATFP